MDHNPIRSVQLNCPSCGNSFHVFPYRLRSGKTICCSRSCAMKMIPQNLRNNWRGGKTINKAGYVLLRINGKYVYEHRYVMEQMLGRPLESDETVHHVDKNKANNSQENLLLLQKKTHDSIETSERWLTNKESFNGGVLCGKPRTERHGRGKFCRRRGPCPHHN